MEAKRVNSETTIRNLFQDLIEACKSGDQRAQFKVYRMFSKPMYDLSMGIVNNRNEALEITQESFFFVFEEIDRFSEGDNFSDWLQRIVVTRSVDSLSRGRFLLSA